MWFSFPGCHTISGIKLKTYFCSSYLWETDDEDDETVPKTNKINDNDNDNEVNDNLNSKEEEENRF